MASALAIGIALAVVHLVAVATIVRTIVSGIEPAWPMLWLILFWVDLPFSLIWLAIEKMRHRAKAPPLFVPWLRAPLNDLDNFVLPFLILGVGGTVWWFLLPQFVGQVIA